MRIPSPATIPNQTLTIADVLYACGCGSASGLNEMRPRLAAGSVEARMVDAALAQCEGEVRRAERLLNKAWESAAPAQRPYVADLWIPLLISTQRFAEAEEALAAANTPDWATPFAALRCVLAAARGDLAASRLIGLEVEDAVDEEPLPATRWRVHQRLALAGFYRGEAETALRHAEEAVALARAADAPRSVAAAESVAYATHHAITGDTAAALRHADAMANVAEHAGDRSARALGIVAAYEISVEMADDEAASRLMEQLRAEPLPEQYRERFASRLADAILQARGGDYAGARNVVTVLADAADRSAGERALCRAFVALFSLALGDEDAARKLSRHAIAGSARPPAGLPAYELRYRRLARALGCTVCGLLGDAVRADRRADAALLRDDPDIASLVAVGRGTPARGVSAKVRGYAYLVEGVRTALAARHDTGPLTATELEVLRQIDAGLNAPEIARALGRSPFTVRTHVRNAVEKLQARGRIDALSRARKLGLLQNA
jgi:DNA-binding CsgD family transcriptional regulator